MGGHLVVIGRSSPSDFPYKQPQIVRSSVVPVELGGLHSPSIHPVARAAHTVHFLALLNRSKYSSFWYNIVIFLTLLLTCYAIEPPLTLRGPRGLLALSHQMYLWVSGIWEMAFLRILVNNMASFELCLTLIHLSFL